MRFCLAIGLLFLISYTPYAQTDSLNKKRLAGVVTTEAVGYGSSILLLNELWYKYYPRSSFHFFNDNPEWLQMDKFGHGMTSYYMGAAGYNLLRWSGVSKKKSLWYGGTLGSFYLLSMEVLDGFSTNWGFSWGDIAANTAGTSLFMLQQHFWDEQRIKIKFSAHLSPFATYRPLLLGSTTAERLIKDYNGQTYWLSANVSAFLPESSNFPKWLNFAVGYGASEMISGRPKDNTVYTGSFEPFRQYYIAPDIDFTKIPTTKTWLRTIFFCLNLVKVPSPTIEMSKQGTKVYFFYF